MKEAAVSGVTPGGTLRSGLHPRRWSTRRRLQAPSTGQSDPQRAPRTGQSRRATNPSGGPVSERRLTLRAGSKPPERASQTAVNPPAGRASGAAGPGVSLPAPPPQAAGPGGVGPPSPDPGPAPTARHCSCPGPPRSTCLPLSSSKDPEERARGPLARLTEPEAGVSLGERDPEGARETVQRFNGPKPSQLWSLGYCAQGWSFPAPQARARAALRFGVREDLAGGDSTAQRRRGVRGNERPVTSVLGSSFRSVPPGLAKDAAALPGSRSTERRRTSPAREPDGRALFCAASPSPAGA